MKGIANLFGGDRMRKVNFLNILLLFFIIGCIGREVGLDKDEYLESFEASLKSQGMEVRQVQPSTNAVMENVVPYKFNIKETGEEEDAIFIYFFETSSQVENAVKNAEYTITTLTKVTEYKRGNILVVHYAFDGFTEKYGSKIKKAI
ncbi:hypothetical protein [Paenibacillus gallinarum]|uniref:Lipoprotein n=1 Tax=Paenibacillus gallinarum TaxID=2762232 RepID=A0ABR8T5H6_9BACL|nr:hypothetical protein [Paenibacillus gallinarum]MBD7971001.1 hypothetical protein [Paenibacillus gallinarum]